MTVAPTTTPTMISTASSTTSSAATIATATPMPTTAVTATEAVKGLPSKEEVASKLLTLSDMPTGWTTSGSSSDSSNTSTLCGSSNDSGISQVKADADFKKGELGPYATEILAAFKSGDAEAWMKQFKAKFTCSEDTEISDGTPTTFHYSALSFPNLGDETFAIRMTTDAGILGEADVDVVYVRVGNDVLSVLNIGIRSVDSDLTQTLTQKAVDRVRGK